MEPAVNNFRNEYRIKFEASERYVDGPPLRLPELRTRLRTLQTQATDATDRGQPAARMRRRP